MDHARLLLEERHDAICRYARHPGRWPMDGTLFDVSHVVALLLRAAVRNGGS